MFYKLLCNQDSSGIAPPQFWGYKNMAFPMLGIDLSSPTVRGRWSYASYVLYYAYVIKFAINLANLSDGLSSHFVELTVL